MHTVGGGHFGRDKTCQKVSSRYFWKNMTNDIRQYVWSCDTCQKSNFKLKKYVGVLHPIRVDGQVWKRIGIDMVGPLTQTKNGNKYMY